MEAYWNHRVLQHTENGEIYYSIHEVHYNEKDEPEMWTADKLDCFGSTPEWLTFSMMGFMQAMYRPVLRVEGEKLIETDIKIWPIRDELNSEE